MKKIWNKNIIFQNKNNVKHKKNYNNFKLRIKLKNKI